MKIQIRPSNERSLIRFGPVAREDVDSECQVYSMKDPKNPLRIERRFVSGEKSLKLNLEEGCPYLVVVIGDKTAGVASTAGHELIAPFNLFIDPPVDGSKQYLKLNIPTDVPLPTETAAAVKKALQGN